MELYLLEQYRTLPIPQPENLTCIFLSKEYEVDTQTYDIRYCQHRKYAYQAVRYSGNALQAYLMSCIEATEQESRDKCQHNEEHCTLHINSIAYMCTLLCSGVGNEKECFNSIKERCKETKLTTLCKSGLYFELISSLVESIKT